MPPPKADELVVHAVKEQFAGLDFCITSPPPWRTLHTAACHHLVLFALLGFALTPPAKPPISLHQGATDARLYTY